MEQENKPIGYWIKQADNLLTKGINAVHATHGISRTGWQILHSIQRETGIERVKLQEMMQPFSINDQFENELGLLATNGWISHENDQLYLTVSGEAFHTNCLEQQTAFRERAMKHISEQDYNTTLKTLQQLVQNLS